MQFNDEDLENMTDEEINQPCTRGERCPQENFAVHSKVCKVEMATMSHQKAGQSWNELVLNQERFNNDPEHYGGYEDQYGNRDNYEG